MKVALNELRDDARDKVDITISSALEVAYLWMRVIPVAFLHVCRRM